MQKPSRPCCFWKASGVRRREEGPPPAHLHLPTKTGESLQQHARMRMQRLLLKQLRKGSSHSESPLSKVMTALTERNRPDQPQTPTCSPQWHTLRGPVVNPFFSSLAVQVYPFVFLTKSQRFFCKMWARSNGLCVLP